MALQLRSSFSIYRCHQTLKTGTCTHGVKVLLVCAEGRGQTKLLSAFLLFLRPQVLKEVTKMLGQTLSGSKQKLICIASVAISHNN